MKKLLYKEDLYISIIKILDKEFKKDVSKITSNTKLEELNLDSLDRTDLLIALEEIYGEDVFSYDNLNLNKNDEDMLRNRFYTVKTIGEMEDLLWKIYLQHNHNY